MKGQKVAVDEQEGQIIAIDEMDQKAFINELVGQGLSTDTLEG